MRKAGVSLRVVSAVALSALVLWLVVDGRRARNPWTAADFVRKATIELSEEEHQALRKDLEKILATAGVTDKVNLNEPYQTGRLNIYIAAQGRGTLHGLRAGDARYDARTDVIVLHERMLRPFQASSEYASVATSDPFDRSSASYLWFAFSTLHEIAHRTEHRNLLRQGVDAYDARRLEEEADAFALSALADLVGEAPDTYDDRFVFAPSRVRALPQEDRGRAISLALVQAFGISLLFADTDFSPFHQGQAHVKYADRFRPQLARILSQMTTREGRTFGILSLEYLDRIKEAGAHVTREILCDAPIENVHVSEGGLLVTAQGATERVALIKLDGSIEKTTSDEEPIACRFGSAGAREGTSQSDAGRSDDIALPAVPTPEEIAATFYEQQPYAKEIYDSCGVLGPPVKMRAGAVVPFGCSETYTSHELSIDLFLGKIDAETSTLRFDSEARQYKTHKGQESQLVILDHEHDALTYQVINSLTDESGSNPHELTLWAISRLPPQLLASHRLVTDRIPRGDALFEWLRISHPPVLTCRKHEEHLFTCVEFLDSVFAFDVTNGTSGVLFHPAGARMAYLGKGVFAFYSPGGYRIFISRWG
jgi:hypothetical protein